MEKTIRVGIITGVLLTFGAIASTSVATVAFCEQSSGYPIEIVSRNDGPEGPGKRIYRFTVKLEPNNAGKNFSFQIERDHYGKHTPGSRAGGSGTVTLDGVANGGDILVDGGENLWDQHIVLYVDHKVVATHVLKNGQ